MLRAQVLLWLGGLALYVAVPVLGPCYVFPDLLAETAPRYPRSAELQQALLVNYRAVTAVLAGEAAVKVQLVYGIAAMPSLHVATPALFLAHCLERRHALRTPFLLLTLAFLVGSVVTGWHYAVDGYAGILLAVAAWAVARLTVRPPAVSSSPEQASA
jgi:hypothetical protein